MCILCDNFIWFLKYSHFQLTSKTPSAKTAATIVAQYYQDHSFRLLFHLLISVFSIGVWIFWFFGVWFYVYTGPSESSRIGSYMQERGLQNYINPNEENLAKSKIQEIGSELDSEMERMAEQEDIEPQRTDPRDTPSAFEAANVLFEAYYYHFKKNRITFLIHVLLVIVTAGLWLGWYAGIWLLIWTGRPRSRRIKLLLEERGYTFE